MFATERPRSHQAVSTQPKLLSPSLKTPSSFKRSSTAKTKLARSYFLQGKPSTSRVTVFMPPDATGTGMTYAGLPTLSSDICLCAMDSPHLGDGTFAATMEEMGAAFAAAIRKVQDHGPYHIAGYSAGGMFTTETVRALLAAGETIGSVILIDAPCRFAFESFPIEVVTALVTVGNSGSDKEAPQWLLDHFYGIRSVINDYKPLPLHDLVAPVYCIQAADGLALTSEDLAKMNFAWTDSLGYFLGSRHGAFDDTHWRRLFPNSRIQGTMVPGNHLTVMHSALHDNVGNIIRDIVRGRLDSFNSDVSQPRVQHNDVLNQEITSIEKIPALTT